MSNFFCFLIAIMWLQSCASDTRLLSNSAEPSYEKSFFNSKWREQAVGAEEWYYRRTVISTPVNTKAFSLADGHFLHPDILRWEITEDYLIGWKAHAEVIGADNEFEESIRKNYRGAPLLAFRIVEHFDQESSPAHEWKEREFIKVDWSRNLIDQVKRRDVLRSTSLADSDAFLADDSGSTGSLRAHQGQDYFDFTTRHSLYPSMKDSGSYGFSFVDDSAAIVIDIRHSFIKKMPSDFISLSYPDEIIALDETNKLSHVAINKRFGFFRVGFDGQKSFDLKTAAIQKNKIINATLFNIWHVSVDEKNQVIPIKQRTIKPIIYYTNIYNPDDLMAASERAFLEWDKALRAMLFHAQKGRYKNIDDIDSVLILKRNSCSLSTIEKWLPKMEEEARTRFLSIKKALHNLHKIADYHERLEEEIKAKEGLEQLCSDLELLTEHDEEAFIYQRVGDMRFNLLNIVTQNNYSSWSAYAPVLADPLSGEILSATTNINLKYIDHYAEKIANKNAAIKMIENSHHSTMSDEAVKKYRTQLLATTGRAATAANMAISAKHLAFNQSEKTLLKQLKQQQHGHAFFNKNTSSLADAKSNPFMDSVEYVENLSINSEEKYKNLAKDKRFSAIREDVFQSLVLHALGHNLGLKHNTAGASDPLNFDPLFWHSEQLPKDIDQAWPLTENEEFRRRLKECQTEAQLTKNAITTQDCLLAITPMYSSVMAYHGAKVYIDHRLGLYDHAAIKWAYGHLVEVFPEQNFSLDLNKDRPEEWLKFNDYREIPKTLLKDYRALRQRTYQEFSWNGSIAQQQFPKHAVPYSYCDDSNGREGPRCLAYDFGADLRSKALWLERNYWNLIPNELFNDYRAISESTASLSKELQIIDRFTHILHWYYYFLHHEPKFAGSFAEKDYLSALAIGINLFAQIIGSPEAGAHISAPQWLRDEYVPSSRLSASSSLVPFSQLSECEAQAISKEENGQVHGRNDYRFIEVPLGIGRSFDGKRSKGIEESFILDAGSSLVKKYALYRLLAPMMEYRAGIIEKRTMASANWYALFPEAVAKIYHAIISDDHYSLGPVLTADERLALSSIINETDLSLFSGSRANIIASAFDEDLSLFALNTVVNFLPNYGSDAFQKSLHISCEDCGDNKIARENNYAYLYTHLSGYRYKALDFAGAPSIGASLLKKAQQQKELYLVLSACIDDEMVRTNNPLCHCVKTSVYAKGELQCCEEGNPDCSEASLEPVGMGLCSMTDLVERQQKTLATLNHLIGFIEKLRRSSRDSSIDAL